MVNRLIEASLSSSDWSTINESGLDDVGLKNVRLLAVAKSGLLPVILLLLLPAIVKHAADG